MMYKNMFIAALAVTWSLIGCDTGNDPAPPAPPSEPLELLYPAGGESFQVDSTVVIQWRINDSTKITSVMVELSNNNGLTYDFLLSSAGSIPPQTTYLSWTADSGQVSTQCKIEVYEYNDQSINDKSGTFTVHN